MKTSAYRPEFVDQLPDRLESDVLYVSIPCACLAHLCACGCGSLVITPLSPTDWNMTFDGDTVSVSPSIGNWNFPCRSHYWISGGRVEWATNWSDKRVAQNRAADTAAKKTQFERPAPPAPPTPDATVMPLAPAPTKLKRKGFWASMFGE